MKGGKKTNKLIHTGASARSKGRGAEIVPRMQLAATGIELAPAQLAAAGTETRLQQFVVSRTETCLQEGVVLQNS
jgi:hypothetical protein